MSTYEGLKGTYYPINPETPWGTAGRDMRIDFVIDGGMPRKIGEAPILGQTAQIIMDALRTAILNELKAKKGVEQLPCSVVLWRGQSLLFNLRCNE